MPATIGRFTLWFVLLAGPLLLALVFMIHDFQALTLPEAMDQAQVARHLARGEGFTTSFVRPLSLVFAGRIRGHPDLYWAPLYPVLESVVFRLWEPGDKAAATTSAVCWAASVWLLFLLGRRLFSERVAMFSAAAYAVNLGILRLSVQGLSIPLATVVVTGLLLALYVRPDAEGRIAPWPLWRLVLIGLLTGLAVLSEYALIALVPVVLVYLWRHPVGTESITASSSAEAAPAPPPQRPRNWRYAGLVLGVVALTLAPWGVRNASLVKNPFFTLRWHRIASGSSLASGDSIYRAFRFEAAHPAFFKTAPLEGLGTTAGLIRRLRDELPGLLDIYLVGLFLGSLFMPMGDESIQRWRRYVYWMMGLYGATLVISRTGTEHMAVFVPFAVLLATVLLRHLVGPIDRTLLAWPWQIRPWWLLSLPVKRGMALGLIMVILATPLGKTLRDPRRPPAAGPEVQYLSRLLDPDDIVMSDVPERIAWYLDRPALWLCEHTDDFRLINDELGPIDALHLTGAWKRYARTSREASVWWEAAYVSPMPWRGLRVVPAGLLPPGQVLRLSHPIRVSSPTGTPEADQGQ